jgi:hypothetical protein
MDSILSSFQQGNEKYPPEEQIKISLDLQHFGLPDSLNNVADRSKSFYLNPQWPKQFAR